MVFLKCRLAFICLSLGGGVYASGAQQGDEVRNHSIIFKQAIERDLSGERIEARKDYGILRTGPLASVSAIPDAINLFALSLDEQAFEAFKKVQSNGIHYDAEYASLWILLLNAKRGAKNELTTPVSFTTQPAKLIHGLYSMNMTLDAFLDSLSKLTFTSDKARKDAVTQSIFFASCYAKYILKDRERSQRMIKENRSDFLFDSLERPLLDEGWCA